ncbi:MAG: hypothetical protein KIT31_01680 [Deltaproteobacteria bacterium]|nr:hypothetical protein [Deltaproteobacteria bacterium]
MRILLAIGVVLAVLGLVVTFAGNTGSEISVPAIVVGGMLFVVGGTMAMSAFRIESALRRQAAAVAELATRGVRRIGRVREVVSSGVMQPDGAQLVVRIELEGGELVTCHLVEDSEQARARIGNEIAVIEHPDDPQLRAIDGYLPNGRRRV